MNVKHGVDSSIGGILTSGPEMFSEKSRFNLDFRDGRRRLWRHHVEHFSQTLLGLPTIYMGWVRYGMGWHHYDCQNTATCVPWHLDNMLVLK